MMDETGVRGLLSVLQELDNMKVCNTDPAQGVLLMVLEEGWPEKKK